MPVYEYKGQFYELSETDPAAAKAKIQEKLGVSEKPGFLDRFKGTPSWMQSKDGDTAPEAAGGDMTNPMAYLSEAQKTEQGPAMQQVGQGVNRAVQVGAGIAKGAVINPAAAVAQVVGGETGRQFAEQAQKSYETQRTNAGADGFDFAELAGAVVSPVNKLIPTGAAGTVVGRGALGGVVGSVLNPVTGENLSMEDVLAGKVEQAGLGAVVGRLGSSFANALTPTLKPGTRELLREGIPVTPGQAYEGTFGNLFRQIEKLDIPTMRVEKDAVNQAFTKSIGNEVLKSIDDKLPASVTNGQQIFGYIQNKLTQYYDDALAKIGTVKADDDFVNSLQGVVGTAKSELSSAKLSKGFENFIRANIINRFDESTVSGKDLKQIESIFRKKIDSLKGTDYDSIVLKTAYDDAYKAVKGLISRNDSTGSVAKANEAWMKRARIMEAVNKNVAEAEGMVGTFSPAELAKVAAKQGGKAESARGTAPLQEQATRALNVVGDTTGEAAKFRNVMIAGKLTGLGALGLFAPSIAVPILTASGMTYKAAQALMSDPSATRLAVQKAIQENPQLLGNIASQQGLFGAGQQ